MSNYSNVSEIEVGGNASEVTVNETNHRVYDHIIREHE